MDKAMWDKLAAAGGIIGAVLFVLSIIIMGQPPEVGDDATTVVNFFADNSDKVLWSIFLQGLAVLAVLWFMAALLTAMRDAGEVRLATAAALSFAIVFAIGGVAALSRGALAFSLAEDADPGVVLGFYRMSVYLDTAGNVIGAGFFLAVGGACVRSKILPAWWGWVSTLAGLWLIVGATAWKTDGFWSPDQAGFVSFAVFLGWLLVTSILLTMRTGKSSSPA